MRIDLRERTAPEPARCAFRTWPFELGEVYTRATSVGTDCDEVCEACVDWLSEGRMARMGKIPAMTK
jgi:hypothetical protein